MKSYDYKKSRSLFKKAAEVIPCGIYGHYSPSPLVPATAYPFYTAKAKGSHIWDIDGNEFIDYMCAYGPMVTGYGNRKVDEAAAKQAKLGNCVTGAPPVMVELAEYMTDIIPCADWVFFAKNGGDVTNYAVMVSRAATGRNKILMISGGYHGVSPWMQGDGHHGVMDDDKKNVIAVKWNDVAEFEKAVSENRGEIACFISSPYHHPAFGDNEFPAEGYWNKIESICRKEGIVIITDDIRAGFRLDMRGSNEYFGYKSDLICFCKAIANGYPISALAG
ncbi:MAG TPA: aminotransferase class III-fold pyridoxal phosphate-dependent enzyme, partial [Spirochaetota bacterium]|nr:aminotransferase class III-fold pyridoxal phosphate-dependent enzyme [Spirochaetota bacterium]